MHHVDPKIAAQETAKFYDRIIAKMEDVSKRYGLDANDIGIAMRMSEAIANLCMAMATATGIKGHRASGILIAALTWEIETIESVANDVRTYGVEGTEAAYEAETL